MREAGCSRIACNDSFVRVVSDGEMQRKGDYVIFRRGWYQRRRIRRRHLSRRSFQAVIPNEQ